jgi:pimeloyl-ACP methyl ester carboxylesterase
VFLHGFPLSGFTWRNVVPALSGQFTCYAFDLVGFGGTTSPRPADFGSRGQAAVLREALATLGLSEFALVGNDTGGWIARELALLAPAKVTHLALTNTEIPGHRPPWIPMYLRLVRAPGSDVIMPRLMASRRFRRSPLAFRGCFEDIGQIDGEFTREFISPLISSKERLAGMFRFLMEMRFGRIDQFRELHGKLTMPTAFLWGEDDPTFPVEQARAMASQFPDVTEFLTLPGAKLFVQEEFPDAVAGWLTEFLAT